VYIQANFKLFLVWPAGISIVVEHSPLQPKVRDFGPTTTVVDIEREKIEKKN